jgi:hypothetical protein
MPMRFHSPHAAVAWAFALGFLAPSQAGSGDDAEATASKHGVKVAFGADILFDRNPSS